MNQRTSIAAHGSRKARREKSVASKEAIRRALCAGALLACVLGSASAARGQSRPPTEYELKAAFLYNFAKFVEWPREITARPADPVTICVYGEDPFHDALDHIISGKTIGDRTLRILRSKEGLDPRTCQVLFLAASERKRLPQILASLRGAPVLTVGDSANFAQMGGMIGFLMEENKVRFEINLKAAEESHLSLSSKLLALAKTVIGRTGGA